jgi:iron complex outermembrane receptor protein
MIDQTKTDSGLRNRRLLALTSASSLGLAALISVTALAQDTSSAEGGLSEVIVTARYRQENLQQTPLAITAITGEKLEAASLANVTDLGPTVPNLFIHPGDAAEGPTPTISMRGVAQGDYNFTYEPAVGIYVDDVYHNTLFGSAMDLMDLDRVEVLRGPQGTLFGNSSIGGAIRLFSKTPRGDNSGYVEATYGRFNRVDLKGSFDTAIVPDQLFVRISGVSKHKDGYVDILDFTCDMTPTNAGAKSAPMARPSSMRGA